MNSNAELQEKSNRLAHLCWLTIGRYFHWEQEKDVVQQVQGPE